MLKDSDENARKKSTGPREICTSALQERTPWVCRASSNTDHDESVAGCSSEKPGSRAPILGNIEEGQRRRNVVPDRSAATESPTYDRKATHFVCMTPTSSVTAVESWKVERTVLYAVALRGKWMEGRSRSGVPQEVRPVVPVTTSSPRLSFRARSSHCQVLALPQSHSPEGGTLRCQITPGEPTPRLPGVCGCSCVWSALRHTGAMWVAVEGCQWKCKSESKYAT